MKKRKKYIQIYCVCSITSYEKIKLAFSTNISYMNKQTLIHAHTHISAQNYICNCLFIIVFVKKRFESLAQFINMR